MIELVPSLPNSMILVVVQSCPNLFSGEFISESVESNIDVINDKFTTNKFGHLCTTTNIMELGNNGTNSIITLELIQYLFIPKRYR